MVTDPTRAAVRATLDELERRVGRLPHVTAEHGIVRVVGPADLLDVEAVSVTDTIGRVLRAIVLPEDAKVGVQVERVEPGK